MKRELSKVERDHIAEHSPQPEAQASGSLQSAGSGAGPTDEQCALMKAAVEFAWQWGRNQTVHPKMYWLERHLETWGILARAALAYSESLKPPNDQAQPRGQKI